MKRRTTAILMALTVLSAACSANGDADTTAADPTTTTTTPPPQTTTTLFTPITLAPDSEGAVPLGASLTQSSNISTVGMGPVLVGMTVAEAEAAAGMRLLGEPDPDLPDCYFVEPESGIPGVRFMVYEERIGRVDVYASGTVTTISGARIGMTEEEIRALFPGQIEEGFDFRADGRALVFVPIDEVDRDFRVVFEVEDGAVTGMRGGILPPVQLGEGCA